MSEAIQHLENSAALWSALAATFAAIATILLWRTEQKSFRHSARPELVLTGWERKGNSTDTAGPERIIFSIENFGRGPALHVYINSFSETSDGRPMAVLSTISQTIIAANSRVEIPGEITICWKNIVGSLGKKSISISITITCWSNADVFYRTLYELTVIELSPQQGIAYQIAPGIGLAQRTVTELPIWRSKIKRRLSTIPIFGGYFIRRVPRL